MDALLIHRRLSLNVRFPDTRLAPNTLPPVWEELPRKDSNLDKENQNLLCYRYTTRQCNS